ncbi:caspase family protein [Actinomadura barringtoniae]|uniref:Caspase family protein n=1 Tax=Actinomadura barringtoniae TaxID=1427535 RepID=A0A939P6T7_9ACTN|nr:caspase family protein [Actinomadura barringtoniae]MBO2446525.1 caspase family protein [Actinomadura barringtoniae]
MAGRRRALLVAVDAYEDERLPALKAPVKDAHALAEVLADESLGGFEVEILADATSHAITEKVEEVLADSRSDDVVLLHFGCHGLKDDGGGLYLAAHNTVPKRLLSTGVDSAAITRMMRMSDAGSVILLLDCCFGGAFARGMLARAAPSDLDLATRVDGTLSGGRGLAVLTASSAMEWTFEKDGAAHRGEPSSSFFTRALVEGIASGEADRDEDGRISLQELYDYVRDRVRIESPTQTPRKWEFDVQGDLYIARSPRRRVAPGELPGEVTKLLDSRDARVREIGIKDLGQLAAGEDLSLALTARRMLEELADDDSRRASQAATKELDDTRIQLPSTSVDLGLLRPGAAVTPAVVELGGPPLARLSTVRADEGIRAWIDGDRLVVTAVPSEPGAVEGTVALTGPAGDVSVAVKSWVLPDPLPLLDDALALAERIVGNPLGELAVRLGVGWLATQAGDQERAAAAFERAPDLLRVIGSGHYRAMAAAGYTLLRKLMGDGAGAPDLPDWIREPPEPSRGSPELWDLVTALVVDWVALLLGERDTVHDITVNASKLVVLVSDDPWTRATCLSGVAWIAASAGHDEQARTLLHEAESVELEENEREAVRLLIAWVWIRLSDLDQALRLIALAEESIAVEARSGDGYFHAVMGWLAVCAGDSSRARELFDKALANSEGADAETGFKDRAKLRLITAGLAAHVGHGGQALTGAEVAEEEVPSDTAPYVGPMVSVGAALVAHMAGYLDTYGQWLEKASDAVDSVSDREDRSVVRFALEWVRGLERPGSMSALVEAAAELIGAVTRDEPGTIALLALAWIGAQWGAGEQAREILDELEDDLAGDDFMEVCVLVAFGWVAAQAGERERALALINEVVEAVRSDDDEPFLRATALAGLASINLIGHHDRSTMVRDLVGVLVPDGPRTDRTETILRVWTDLCGMLLPQPRK